MAEDRQCPTAGLVEQLSAICMLPSVVCFYLPLLCCETGAHYAYQAGLELTIRWLLPCLESAGMTGVCYHMQLAICDLKCATTNCPLGPVQLVTESVHRTLGKRQTFGAHGQEAGALSYFLHKYSIIGHS